MSNILVNPVAFLLINNIEPPDHWDVNITRVPGPMSPLQVANMTQEYMLTHDNWSAYNWLLTDQPGLFGLVAGWANPTGVILLLVLAIMFICSMKWVRKSGNFEVQFP